MYAGVLASPPTIRLFAGRLAGLRRASVNQGRSWCGPRARDRNLRSGGISGLGRCHRARSPMKVRVNARGSTSVCQRGYARRCTAMVPNFPRSKRSTVREHTSRGVRTQRQQGERKSGPWPHPQGNSFRRTLRVSQEITIACVRTCEKRHTPIRKNTGEMRRKTPLIRSFAASLCTLCVLCDSVVIGMFDTSTTESQRTQRAHREELKTTETIRQLPPLVL